MTAYSRLNVLLKQRQLSIRELHRRMCGEGFRINVKSLHRLGDEHQPVERLDMRVAGAICQVCAAPLSDLIVFDNDDGKLHSLSVEKQAALDSLMARNNAGPLSESDQRMLETLVREAEEIMLTNARLLAAQRCVRQAARSQPARNAS